MPSYNECYIGNAIQAHRLRLRYQPRFSPQSMSMIGVHGYAQWQSDWQRWTTISPTENLSINQFYRLWLWQLSQVKHLFHSLSIHDTDSLASSPPFSISISLSPLLLHADDWAIQLLCTLDDAHIPGSFLEVELLGHGSPLNTLYVDWSFEAIRNAGIRLVLNDFPVNVNCLSHLTRHAFDRIKIHSSFMPSPLDSDMEWARKKALLEGMAYTIKKMGAEGVIDGIETNAHIQLLRDLPTVEWRGTYWDDIADVGQILAILHQYNGKRLPAMEDLMSRSRLCETTDAGSPW